KGEETARLRLTDDVVGAVVDTGSELYFGYSSLYHLGPAAASGTRARIPHYAPAAPEIQGNPQWMPNPYEPPPSAQSALHRVRLLAQPVGTDPVVPADHQLYVLFHRVLFALDAAGGEARWAHTHDADV